MDLVDTGLPKYIAFQFKDSWKPSLIGESDLMLTMLPVSESLCG